MAPRETRVLFEDREILVLHRPGRSDFTLVTFADLTFRPSGTAFWGMQPVEKLDLDAIGFVAKRENWYPAASVEAAAPAVRGALKPRSIAYGYSMGAHAALKHGRRLGLDAAFAVSPQVSIAPADVPWDARYHQFHRPVPNQGMIVAAEDLAPFAAVLADPYDALDWRHAQMAAQGGGARLLRAPLAGHSAIWLLADTKALAEILRPALAGDLAGMRAVLRAGRAGSGQWFRLMGRAACRRRHVRLSEVLWQRAGDLGVPAAVIDEDREESLADRADDLARAGRRAEALAACQDLIAGTGPAAAARQPCRAATIGRAGHILLHAGAPARAEAAFRQAIAGGAGGADLHVGLSLALVAQDRRAEAIAAARSGHAVLPAEAGLATHLGHLLVGSGEAHLPEAEAVFRAVLQNRPANGQALYGLSLVLARRAEIPQALDLAHRATLRLPRNPDVAAWLAHLALRSGDAGRAERLFRRVAAGHPRRPEGHVGLSAALGALGRRQEALAALEHGLTALPGHAELLARKRALMPPGARLAGWLQRLFGGRRQ